MIAVLKAIADAPPPMFSGGGKWEAMHGDMSGFYEIRLERDGAKVGLGGPSLVLIAGKDKPFRTVLSTRDYAEIRRLGHEYLARAPRSVAP